MELSFRQLRADEIEVRTVSEKNGKMSLLLYQDARCGMRILDETVGKMGWICRYERLGESLACGIAIKNEDTNEWIWKWNIGDKTGFEATKGEASDSFKRSCVLWGIGRALYSAPKISLPESKAKFSVAEIGYEGEEIVDLTIVDWNGVEVFKMENRKVLNVSSAPKESVDNIALLKQYCRALLEEGYEGEALKKFYKYYESRVVDWRYALKEKKVRELWEKWKA